MPLVKRQNVYWADIQLFGKRFRESLHTSNKKLAERLYAKKKNEIEDDLLKENKPIKLRDFFNEYCSLNDNKISLDREKQRIKIILGLWGQDIFLHEISIEKIEQLRNYLQKQDREGTTVNRYYALLRMLINRAINMEKLDGINPFRKIKFFREGGRGRRDLTDDEVRLLLDAAYTISSRGKTRNQRYFYDVMMIAANTGMRIGEILNIKKKDIDFNRGVLFIERTKSGIPREMPIPESVKQILLNRIPEDKEGFLFPIKRKNKSGAFRDEITRIRLDTGVDNFLGFHNLRHTVATRLAQMHVEIPTVQELLGHTNPSTTFLYTHTSFERKKAAISASQIRHTARDLKNND
jgi:integrase